MSDSEGDVVVSRDSAYRPLKPQLSPGQPRMPELPEGFPVGVVNNLAVKVVRRMCAEMGKPQLYDRLCDAKSAEGYHRSGSSLWARRKALFELWELDRARVESLLARLTEVSPADLESRVRASGRTCDYDTLLDWVASHQQTDWADIVVDAIPDPRAVGMLTTAKEKPLEFWRIFGARRAKDVAPKDDAEIERVQRKRDDRQTRELIEQFRRALEHAR